MSDYDLYYWSVPFRGQFVRAVLAYAGKTWTERGDGAISKLMNGPVKQMPVPFMGPPLLIDKKADFAIAEMPAIVLYLGETLDLMPATPALRAMTMKIVNDANDVIDERGGRICLNTVSLSISGSSAGLVRSMPVSGPCARRA